MGLKKNNLRLILQELSISKNSLRGRFIKKAIDTYGEIYPVGEKKTLNHCFLIIQQLGINKEFNKMPELTFWFNTGEKGKQTTRLLREKDLKKDFHREDNN
jgi:hypothetical protein